MWLVIVALLLVALIVGLFSGAQMSSSAAQYETARAAVEAARAAQIASAGQAESSFWLGVIATVLVLAVVALLGLVVVRSLKQAPQPKQRRGKAGDPQMGMGNMAQMDPMQLMTMMMYMRMMGIDMPTSAGKLPMLSSQKRGQVIEPVQDVYEEDEEPQWWAQ